MSDRTYLILEGAECFYFGGEEKQYEETVRVKKADVLLIPEHTVNDYGGHVWLFLTHSPAYEPNLDVHYDDLWD